MGILSMIGGAKSKFRQRQMEKQKIAAQEEAKALQSLKTERITLEKQAKSHQEFLSEKERVNELKQKVPKYGLAKIADNVKKGAVKLKQARDDFKQENPDFGKSRGIFANETFAPPKKGKKEQKTIFG